ncbi:MAG: hypothetical protein H8D80_00540 [Proteobacteria bacterium]|nr:hypothetical protein [Pseudomonadota bacterium]
MFNKSVAILGKGPSVSRCTQSFIDKFGTVVGCGKPVFDGYEDIIGNRMHYDYSNRTSTDYEFRERDRLGIIKTINTGSDSEIRKNFKYKNLDPSTGILAFHEYVTNPNYDIIAIIGFDLFQTNKKMYYFKNEDFDPAVDWLWADGTYDESGNLTTVSGHNTELTHEYLQSMFDLYPEKKFYIFSSYSFEKRDNLVIM